MTKVTITKAEYKKLQEAQEELNALEAGGVDNWEWYDESLGNLRKERDRRELIEAATENLLFELSEHIDAPAGHEAGYSICGDEPYDIVLEFLKTVKELEND